MQDTLDALIEARRAFVASAADNNFTSGLHRLLTDLYPDTAHFVYELLQNAEDADATEVEFSLEDSGVYFAHNGAREFTLEDIKAITSIGSNKDKRDTPTAIGEFGVGFKAVFAYTACPEIHSGPYHFCIHDFFVPDTRGVTQSFIRHEKGSGWTEFYFPFDNPNKPADMAYRETLTGLQKLDGTALLFLRHIQKITCSASGVSNLDRHLVRNDSADNVVEILEQDANREMGGASRYLRFVKEVEIDSSRSKKKRLPIGVAYGLKKGTGGTDVIVPVENARTFIYFPADKERSNLKFHINAPFSATVARDSILDCDDNRMLLEQVADLVCESLGPIRALGMLDLSFYAVMPNAEDQLDGYYPIVRKKVIDAFKGNAYLVARNGGYLAAKNAIAGPRVFSDLLDAVLLDGFAETKKRWIRNPMRNVNKREEAFLRSLDIDEYTEKSFADAFNSKRHRSWLVEYAQNQDEAWLKLLYAALAQVYATQSETRSSLSQVYSSHIGAEESHDLFERFGWRQSLDDCVNHMKQAALVKCRDGKLRRPGETFFLPKGFDAQGIRVPLIDPAYVDGKQTRNYDPAVTRRLFEFLGAREYSLQVVLELLAEKYKKEVNPRDPNYYQDLMTMAHAHKQEIDIDVSGQALFIGNDETDKMRLCKADDLVVGDEYGNSHGDDVARFTHKATLAHAYRAYYTEKRGYKEQDLRDFVEWVEYCGAHVSLDITECDVRDNPHYGDMLMGINRRSAQMRSVDYTIRGLPKSLTGISYGMSHAIWQLLCQNGSTSKYAEACIWPSARAKAISAESKLIYYLKAYPWVPNIEGVLCKPGEVAYRDLDSQFRAMARGSLIEALELGSEISGRKQAEQKLEADARRLDRHVVSSEDWELLQVYKERRRKAEERAEARNGARSAQEVFDGQDKEGKPQSGDYEFDTGTVSNPQKRATRIADTIRDSECMPVRKREAYSTIYVSSKAEKANLQQWYHGRCQICGSTIPASNGTRYFEAINIISTAALPDRMRVRAGSF